jgi:hypothetical protein
VSADIFRFFTYILLFMIYLATLTVASCVTASNDKMINDLERLWVKAAVERVGTGHFVARDRVVQDNPHSV